MNRIALLCCGIIMSVSAFAQVGTNDSLIKRPNYNSDYHGDDYGYKYSNNNYGHGDSVYYLGRYYSEVAYEKIMHVNDSVYSRNHYESYFMPGALYTVYQPAGKDSLGTFSGIAIEYVIFALVRDDEGRGPSHSRMYLKFNILNSTKKDIQSLFTYSLGFDLSLERHPNRKYLIPFFGLEIGGMSQKQLGGILQFTPTFGLHILATHSIYLSARAGYQYTSTDFDMLKGWYGQAGLDIVFW